MFSVCTGVSLAPVFQFRLSNQSDVRKASAARRSVVGGTPSQVPENAPQNTLSRASAIYRAGLPQSLQQRVNVAAIVLGHVRVDRREILDSRMRDVDRCLEDAVRVKLAARLRLESEVPQGGGRRNYVLAAGAAKLVDGGEGEDQTGVARRGVEEDFGLPGEASMRTPLTGSSSSELSLCCAGSWSGAVPCNRLACGCSTPDLAPAASTTCKRSASMTIGPRSWSRRSACAARRGRARASPPAAPPPGRRNPRCALAQTRGAALAGGHAIAFLFSG